MNPEQIKQDIEEYGYEAVRKDCKDRWDVHEAHDSLQELHLIDSVYNSFFTPKE